MNALVAILSPLALLLPAVAGTLPAGQNDGAVHEAAERAIRSGFGQAPASHRDARP